MKIGFNKTVIWALIMFGALVAVIAGFFHTSNELYKLIAIFLSLCGSIFSYILKKDDVAISEIIKKTSLEVERAFEFSIEKRSNLNKIISKANPLAKLLFRNKLEKYKNKNSGLSKKGVIVTEIIVKLEAKRLRTIAIVLFMIMNIEYIFFSKYDGIDAVSVVQLSLFCLLVLRYLLIRFRVDNGYFGLNRHEAMMIISFIEKNKDDLNGSGGEKAQVFKGKKDRVAEDLQGIIGGVVTK